MTEPAFAFERLGFRYGRGPWVFRDHAAMIARGSVFAILGPNGRGKTTLLKVLAGILAPVEGVVTARGESAYVPQLFSVAFGYSALDMVLMGRARHVGLLTSPSRVDVAIARRSLARFDVADLADRPFAELSGGQRQLVVLARALASEAATIILDEPTSSLDLRAQGVVVAHLRRLARDDGTTVVFTTHDPNHALHVADDVLLMFGSRDYAHGPASATLTEDALGRLYGVPMRRLYASPSVGDDAAVAAIVPVYRDPHS